MTKSEILKTIASIEEAQLEMIGRKKLPPIYWDDEWIDVWETDPSDRSKNPASAEVHFWTIEICWGDWHSRSDFGIIGDAIVEAAKAVIYQELKDDGAYIEISPEEDYGEIGWNLVQDWFPEAKELVEMADIWHDIADYCQDFFERFEGADSLSLKDDWDFYDDPYDKDQDMLDICY